MGTIMKFIFFISFISLLEIQEIFGTQDYTTDQYERTTGLPETTTAYEEEPTTYEIEPQNPTVKSGCGSPQFAKDKYCDDDNNNAECQYDDGACCNKVAGWNNFCSDCQCKREKLDPSECKNDEYCSCRLETYKGKTRCQCECH